VKNPPKQRTFLKIIIELKNYEFIVHQTAIAAPFHELAE
jgi:hypothetical protein